MQCEFLSCLLVYELRMDEALLTFHSELPYSVSVLYTSDYCYKVILKCIILFKTSITAHLLIQSQYVCAELTLHT